MYTLNKVRDLVLDFAQKTAEAYCYHEGNQDVLNSLRDGFVKNMLSVRDQMPARLFLNYDHITEEEAATVFQKIKSSVQNTYRIPGISGVTFCSVNIGGNVVEIPSYLWFFYKNGERCPIGTFMVYYDTNETKRSIINSIVLNTLVSLPIKKIKFTFVDLGGAYESELLLRYLPPSIYNEHPITSSSQMEELLKRLERRKEELITKYGDYPTWCKNHHEIPVPYEIIVLYDESYPDDYRFKMNSIIEYGVRIGVFFIATKNVNTYVFGSIIKSPIFDRNKKEILVDNRQENLENCFLPPYTGVTCYFHEEEGRRDVLPEDGGTNFLYAGDPTRDQATMFDPKKWETDFIWKFLRPLSPSNVIEGSGDFEVYHITRYLDNCYTKVDFFYNLMGCFQSKKEAITFVSDYCAREEYSIEMAYAPAIGLTTTGCGFWSNKATLELYIEGRGDLLDYSNDLLFYFSQFGFTNEITERIFGLIDGNVSPKNPTEYVYVDYKKVLKLRLRYWKEFPNREEADRFRIQLLNHIEKQAIKLWGEDYIYDHLHIIEKSFSHENSGYLYKYLKIKENKHIAIPVEHYEDPHNDGIINFTPITSNETLLKACFDYIRTEAEAKEEMQVQTLDFGSAAESKYEPDLSTMVVPVGKAESKDADFRMDLVSHVHSFIIGQSGSGKSVFLHNIIGGAMLKYAPEDLQLYLLDFKLGGVEFNRYQGAKHVKALLVDNSDPQVTLEILRELRGSMTERGKLLRKAGVNNIGEYNKLHQEDRMPHVLVVADECHEMFRADDSIPRQVRNEISDIVIKIAKEGRSQGVHLVFATQTLSGTEMSSEIINNVSDFYLLKCAQTDSERLVPNSSNFTSELSTGQIYYHHVDEQVKFQAYYTDKEAAEKLMVAVVEKAKDHKSNGEFYFNGAQMFYLDESVKEQMLAVKGKSPLAFMGKAIDISQKDLYIKLNEDFSENVLLLGLNDQEQVTRTTMNLFVSLMMSAKLKHKDIAFKVIDCLNNEEGEVHELIFDLENEGYCEIIERRQRSKFFKELAQGVLDGTAEETILLILGQDRFRELKMNMELEENISSKSNDDDDMMSISDDFFGDNGSSSSSVRTYREALYVILDKGPDYGVHTLLQLEKASNLLFEDYITPKVVFQKFKHLVMLKSDEAAGVTLHLNDDIRLEKLSSDWERLRAYYYAEESDSYTLFTPYMPSKSKDIINLLNTL